MSPADTEIARDVDRAPGVNGPTPRAAAVAQLAAAVQARPGHVVVIGTDARAASELFAEAEPHLVSLRSVRVRGRALEGQAAVAALCADKEQKGYGWEFDAMRALVAEARAAALPSSWW